MAGDQPLSVLAFQEVLQGAVEFLDRWEGVDPEELLLEGEGAPEPFDAAVALGRPDKERAGLHAEEARFGLKGPGDELTAVVVTEFQGQSYVLLNGPKGPASGHLEVVMASNRSAIRAAWVPMRLISLLEACGLKVLVGFCSMDVALWKSAGATDCATGKFFNLRRFTRSRFAPPAGGGGGGQIAYACEEALFAYLRAIDIVRVQAEGGFSTSTVSNPFMPKILQAINEGKPWLAQGWREYLW